MAVIPPDIIPERSALWGLSFTLERLQSRFYSLYQDIYDVWMIGQYLAWPFWYIAFHIGQGVSLLRQGDVWIVTNRSWLEGLFFGSSFRQLLDDVSSTLRWVRIDPLGWLIAQINILSGDLRRIINNPIGWIRDRVLQIFPALNDLQYNPVYWLRNQIQVAFSAAFVFLLSPRNTLRTWITQISPFMDGLVTGGFSYILNRFLSRASWFTSFLSNPIYHTRQWITSINPDLAILMNNPKEWFDLKIARTLGITDSQGRSLSAILGLVVLRHINNHIATQRKAISDQICGIIVKFL